MDVNKWIKPGRSLFMYLAGIEEVQYSRHVDISVILLLQSVLISVIQDGVGVGVLQPHPMF